ncbi:unnamed protein product [Rotaria sp. Silwood2]|nr:unnamed protein product [Rotaria sp. Silwood2]CAF3948116.1 unnamed protein product [Rotaria sp. Silwood2]
MYYLNEKGERVYTFKKVDPLGHPTQSAHPGKPTNCKTYRNELILFYFFPAKFSPDDQYSRQRLKLKTRYKLLLTQTPLDKC